jgi:hypothetical protein
MGLATWATDILQHNELDLLSLHVGYLIIGPNGHKLRGAWVEKHGHQALGPPVTQGLCPQWNMLTQIVGNSHLHLGF